MLHLEFAVAPNHINSLSDLVILESRMGFEKEVFYPVFPKHGLERYLNS